jgi:hypothetical protein
MLSQYNSMHVIEITFPSAAFPPQVHRGRRPWSKRRQFGLYESFTDKKKKIEKIIIGPHVPSAYNIRERVSVWSSRV